MKLKSLPFNFSKDLFLGMEAAVKAGQQILAIYHDQVFTKIKHDGSPVTNADMASQKILTQVLGLSGYPIISEESVDKKKDGKNTKQWIVDPLDGTKDFMGGTDEFSVLIGLLDRGVPSLGIVYQPTVDCFWVAEKGNGAYKYYRGQWEKLIVTMIDQVVQSRAFMSRNHLSEKEKFFLDYLKINNFIQKGSSGLKMAGLASGEAELYFSFTDKISQWDTCAGCCLIEEAGGKITDMDGNLLSYGGRKKNHINGVLVTNGYIHDIVIKAVQDFVKFSSGS